MLTCLCGKTIRKAGEIWCSTCKKKYNPSPKISVPKVSNYSSPGKTCLCGKKIRGNNQLFCSACRKKMGYP